MVTRDKELQAFIQNWAKEEILNDALTYMLTRLPVEEILEKIVKVAVNDPDLDLYAKEKKNNNLAMLKVLPEVSKLIDKQTGNARLALAAKYAILGNLIDFTDRVVFPSRILDLSGLNKIRNFYVNHTERLLEVLNSGKKIILYILNNAGEVIFDSLFIKVLQEMGHEVIISARAAPAQNDVTVEDVEDLYRRHEGLKFLSDAY